jgi:hypothetical protein
MKLIKYSSFVLIVAFICWNGNVFAQAKWVPGSISMNISGIETYSDWSECPGNVHDTSWQESGSENIGISNSWGSLSAYSRIGNTISISWSAPYNGDPCNYDVQVSFDLDSVNSKLNNFYMSYNSPDYRGGCISSSVRIPSMNFEIPKNSGDTILIASGGISTDSITSGSYENSTFGNCNVRLAHYGTGHGLTNGSIGYSITLVIPQPVNAVSESNFAQQNIKIFSKLLDNAIHFSFPTSDQPQPLLIYDILGREIKRIEIPSGVSEYSVPQGQLPSGYYFARLGNMGAKFMVY